MAYNQMNFNDYDNETIKHLRNVQLMILKDFIDICEKNNIEYYSYGGTTLGAIRHKGYIPWDDDIDVILFRDQYEKFVEVFESLNSKKYTLLTLENTEDYYYFLSKLSLNGTEFKQGWSKNTKFKLGINIDIFILDYVPDNTIKRFIYFKQTKLIGYLLAVYIVILNKNYPSKSKKIIAEVSIYFLRLFGITSDKLKKKYINLVKKNNNENYNHVFENGAVCYNKPFPKNIFKPAKSVPFEFMNINVPADFDKYLTIMYGDYMKLPKEEDRIIHEHEYIDFGEY